MYPSILHPAGLDISFSAPPATFNTRVRKECLLKIIFVLILNHATKICITLDYTVVGLTLNHGTTICIKLEYTVVVLILNHATTICITLDYTVVVDHSNMN